MASSAPSLSAEKLKCQACETENPSNQKFCGNCGKSLSETDYIFTAVDQILKQKFRSTEFVEITTAEKAMKRVQLFLGLFVAPIALVLSFLGYSKLQDFNQVGVSIQKIQENAQKLQDNTKAAEGQLADVKKQMDGASLTLKEAEQFKKKLHDTEASVKKLNSFTTQVAEGLKSAPTAGVTATDQSEDSIFNANRTNELALARFARNYFIEGNYKAAIRFYSQARLAQSSGVWQSDYPYLAAAYLLSGDSKMFSQTLSEMLQRVAAGSGYLGNRTPLTFVFRALGDVRSKLPAGDKAAIAEIDKATDAIQQRMNSLPQ